MMGLKKPVPTPNLGELKRASTSTRGGTNIYFRIHYKLKNGSIGVTNKLRHICWGWLGSKEGAQDKVSTPDKPVLLGEFTDIEYILTKVQQNDVKQRSGKKNAEAYLQVLQDAGVAQWFSHVPTTIEEFTQGCKITCAYPSPMIVGLLEMYRNLLYYPDYVAYVVELRKKGYSAGASLIMPRILRFHPAINLPIADAMGVSVGYDWVYRSDLFSERHVMECLRKFKRAPLTQNADYHGVFQFFHEGYKRGVGKVKEYGLSTEETNYNQLDNAQGKARNRATNYGENVTYRGSFTKKVLDTLAQKFDVSFERTHEA